MSCAHLAVVAAAPKVMTGALRSTRRSRHCCHMPCFPPACLPACLPACHQADKLLSPEFQPVVEQLISFLPQNRQICLYR